MKAADVQAMIGVEDHEVVAHGYTLDRETLDVWFAHGELVRRVSCDRFVDLCSSEKFDPEFFFMNVKRWYRDRTNRRLAGLFEAFGRPLPLIDAATYPKGG